VERLIRSMKCGNYFAPSNLPEAGFSQYTAVPYSGKGTIINSATPTLVIPVTRNQKKWILHEYVWSGKTYGSEYETVTENVVLGPSLANFHPGRVNMDVVRPVWQPILDACVDPGAGASSDYQGCAFTTISNDNGGHHELQAGEELFVSYGEQWFKSRSQFNHTISRSEHYQEANAVLQSLWRVGHSWNELLTLASNVLADRPLTRQVLPKTPEEWEQIMKKKKNDDENNLAQIEPRSLEWLEEHGQCMDHIYMNVSTIRQAGQGAFSRRNLTKGTTIISSPMIHVWDRSTMEQDELNSTDVTEGLTVNPTMQMLNYQFSHAQSSLYLLPINQMAAINHAGSATNAKLQWATWDKKSSYYLQRPMEDLKKEPYSTMVMDVIATRDITEDEEIFIDYGKEWETAWQRHVQNWKSPCTTTKETKRRRTSYEIYQMNHDKFNTTYHKWSDDHFTTCSRTNVTADDYQIVYILENEGVSQQQQPKGDSSSRTHATNYQGITIHDEGFRYSQQKFDRQVPCKILSSSSSALFEVALFFDKSKAIEVYPAMTASQVKFLPKPYRSDMHHPQAFRHEISIPTEIFPKQWMDLK